MRQAQLPVRAGGEKHGPYWTLRWRDGTAHRRRYVRPEDLEAVRTIIEQRRRERAELRADMAEADRLLWALRGWPKGGPTLGEALATSRWSGGGRTHLIMTCLRLSEFRRPVKLLDIRPSSR